MKEGTLAYGILIAWFVYRSIPGMVGQGCGDLVTPIMQLDMSSKADVVEQ